MIDEKTVQKLMAQGEGQRIEFKESIPSKVRELSEEVCAFANASGGIILIGVTDENTFAQSLSIDNDKRAAIQNSLDEIAPEVECAFYPLSVDGHNIWVLEVPEGNDKPYFTSGSVYVRKGATSKKLRSPADVRQMFDDAGKLNYDKAINKWFQWENISERAVNEFKEKAGITSSATYPELFRNLDLLGPKGEMTNIIPMFFSADACGRQIPQAVIRCILFKGTERVHIIDSKTIGGPILTQYNEATRWLKQRLAVEYIMDGFNPRIEKWEIPLDAIKEALTNAICHRDYYDTATNIMVELYDDRLEIANPGGLLSIVAKNFGHMSKSRNPKIFELFTRMDLVEKAGSGIPRIADLMKEENLPAPEYRNEGYFTTILYKASSTTKSEIRKEIISEKTPVKTREKIREKIRENPRITTAELAILIGVSNKTIEWHIAKMKAEGSLKREGPDKGGYWKVNNDEIP